MPRPQSVLEISANRVEFAEVLENPPHSDEDRREDFRERRKGVKAVAHRNKRAPRSCRQVYFAVPQCTVQDLKHLLDA